MSNETIKTKPPTCRELQARIDALCADLDTAKLLWNAKCDVDSLNALDNVVDQLRIYANKLDNTKLDAEASRMITADVKSALSTATKYYEQAHAIYNDTLAASKTVAKTAQSLAQFERVLANYYRLPWYKRIFSAPHFGAKEKT